MEPQGQESPYSTCRPHLSRGLDGAQSRHGSRCSVYLTLSPTHPSRFLLCAHVSRPHLCRNFKCLISFVSCYCFMALPLKGLLSDLGCESQFTREPLQNNVLSIGTSHEMKTIKLASEQDSLRYSSPFSANKLIAFQT